MNFWREVWAGLKPFTIELLRWAGAGVALNLLGVAIFLAFGPKSDWAAFPFMLAGFCCLWFVSLRQAWRSCVQTWRDIAKPKQNRGEM